jgi:hypothetical protein
MDQDAAKNAFFKDFLAFQKELKPIPKNDVNPHFRSKFLNIEGLLEYVLPLLNKHNLTIRSEGRFENNQAILLTVLQHVDGYFIISQWPIITANNSPQSLGQASTYARRYATMALLGVAPSDDDDGEASEIRQTPKSVTSVALAPKPIPNYASQAVAEMERVKADAKPVDQGIFNPGDYVVPFGKFDKGKRLRDLDLNNLADKLKWAKSQAKPSDLLKEFIQYAGDYLHLSSSMAPPTIDQGEELPF